ncbi:MAG: single-stranded DNA-binding protein [Planctomycetota bacterium]|nr:single-stranded DNA-binding protein [Planctomycetota bacterium]
MNRVFLMGNLTRDPELSYTPQGIAVCKFGLAVNNVYVTSTGEKKEDVLFVDIVVWRKQAESCATFLKKGRPVLVEGNLKLDRWEKDGQKHSKIKVVANRVQFIGDRAKSELTAVDKSAKEEDIPVTPPEEIPDDNTEENISF